MTRSFDSLGAFLDHAYDDIIDVRSPAEFAEDHVPGAINLPVLSNEERAQVGTIYKQDSAFRGRKVGAALVFQNAARHIAGPLADRDGAWRPLVYCWRGGQRSGAFSWMLREIGWRADTVAGGYRSWRRLVNAMLYEQDVPHRLILLDGNTGTAKTDILKAMAGQGAQVIDLEGLACHRGSLLGATGSPQPSQKSFESQIAAQLSRLDPARPVWVEAESNRIGTLLLPPALWTAMKTAPRVEVAAPLPARAAYLVEAYHDVLADGPRLRGLLDHLREVRGHAVVGHWHQLSRDGKLTDLTEALMRDHYDPAYTRARAQYGHENARTLSLTGLQREDILNAANMLCDMETAITSGEHPVSASAAQ